MDTANYKVKIGTDTTEIESAIEKVNELKSLLQEVKKLVSSLNLEITLGNEN